MANVKDLLVNGSARVIGTIYGNATSANKVNNKLTIKLNTGTTEGTNLYTFDGSAVKILDIKSGTGLSFTAAAGALTIKHSNSVTAGTAQGDANKTLTFGGTFTIPTITYDAQGHITGKGTTTMTMPANPNTWRGIQNNLTSDSTTDSLSAAQGKALKALIDGKSSSNHTHSYLPLSGGTMTGSPVIKFPASAGTIAASDPMTITYGRISAYGNLFINANTDNSGTEYIVLTAGKGLSSSTSDGLAVGTSTLTWLGNTVLHSGNYTSYTVTKTGSGASGTWGISITGNAATATKLQTARTINGTNFDGSANITTANWGTSRTLTIGNKAQSVNGSSNVTWTLDDIGASDRYLLRNNHVSFTVDGDADIYYPVLISAGQNNTYGWDLIHITRGYSATAPDTWNTSTHRGGLTLTLRWTGDTSWGGNDKTIVVEEFQESYSTMVGGLALSSNGLIVWLRGGGAVYRLGTAYGKAASATVYLTDYTASNKTVFSPRSYNADTVNSEVKGKWYIRQNQFYGNASTATTASTCTGNAATATNADKIDGYHASSLIRSDGGVWNPGANIQLNAAANSQEWSFDIRRNGYTGCYWHVWDSEKSSLLSVKPDDGKVYAPYGFVGNLEGNAATATKLGTSTVGGTTTPIYLNGGVPTALGYTIAKSVPSDAKFTDTTYSAGTGLSLSGTTFNHKNSVTAATAQGDASKTLTFGGTFTIPTVTYDAQGHITAKGTTTMTMPANPNTWRGIQNNLTSDSTTDSLSAAQGKALKALIDGKANSSHTHSYLPLSGGTLTGSVTFANGTYNVVGDDAAFGDINNAGTLAIQGRNGNTNIWLVHYGESWSTSANRAIISYNGTNIYIDKPIVGNLSGNATTATQDASGNTLTNSYLRRYDWWNDGNGNNVDNLRAGTTFAYTSHNAPLVGTIVAFDCRGNENYTLQLMGHYWNNSLYFRNRNGDRNTWNAWRQIWAVGDSVTGAVWNDYAEYREVDTLEGGRCVYENGDDSLSLTTKRLMRGCEITSDTWGFAQGETDKAKTPIAVAGRVLAYPYEDRDIFRNYIGYSVCSGPNGTVSLMTEEEELKYPWAIVGTVSAVPDYEEWGGGENADRPSVKVDGRIWIKIK